MGHGFEIKQGDRLPDLKAFCEDGDGVRQALSSAVDVRLLMRASGAATPVVDATASWSTATTGATVGFVMYAWASGQTATPGHYQAEVEVTFPGDITETYPNRGFLSVEINPAID
jgi:hypothetical protein